MSEPDVEIPESGKIILSSDEDDMDEKMLENTLNSFGVQHGTIMIVEDFQVENSILRFTIVYEAGYNFELTSRSLCTKITGVRFLARLSIDGACRAC